MKRMNIGSRTFVTGVMLAGVLLAMSWAAATTLWADSVEDFYRGRTMKMVIGYSAGGGYDLYARVLARHLGKHIPGKPQLVPQNMPGAASAKAANYLYSVGEQDGSIIAIIGQNLPLTQALGDSRVKFDATKFHWIGNLTTSPNVMLSWHSCGIKTAQDFFQKEFITGATGKSSTSYQYPTALKNLLGAKIKVIKGYPGGKNINLAMERGEVCGRGSNSWASVKATMGQMLEEKKINILVQIGRTRHPELPDVPLLTEMAKDETQRKVLALVGAGVDIGRPFLVGPKVPAERVAALRKAFDAMLLDEGFLEDIKRGKLDLSPVGGAQLQKIVTRVVNSPPDIVKLVGKAIK